MIVLFALINNEFAIAQESYSKIDWPQNNEVIKSVNFDFEKSLILDNLYFNSNLLLLNLQTLREFDWLSFVLNIDFMRYLL